ncbi:MAG: ABC transporter ATP-binding protein [Vampirovibrionales bacterium]|nr:ABC transporter ATP-binding protein [Vampirovibrionales bacterium]
MPDTPTTAPDSKTAQVSMFIKYRGLFLKYKVPFTLGILALLATNAAGAMIPDLIQQAIDLLDITKRQGIEALSDSQTQQAFEALLFQMLGLSVLVFAARLLSRYWIIGAGQRLEYDLRNRVYQHILKMPNSFFSANPSGELMSRMTNDVESLRMMIGGGLMLGFNTFFVYCTTLPMMIRISPMLTLLTFILYPFGIWALSKISSRVKALYYQVQDVLGQISTVVQENFTGIAVIQAYAKETVENTRMQNESRRYLKVYQQLIHKRVILMMIFVMLGGLSYLAVLSFGGWQVIDQKITLGGFIAFTLFLERIAWPTASMGWTISTVQQGAAALKRVDDILSQESTITSPDNPEPLPQPVKGDLNIRDLSFTYLNPYAKKTPVNNGDENQEEEDVLYALKNITLHLPAGQTVAIVGPIGAGKSTLLRLLPRLLETPDNTVFIDSVDITRLSLEALRKTIALMPQQSYLFSNTIANNIVLAKPEEFVNLRESHVIPATKAASVHPEIQAMMHQYETTVGERGVMLSGGQRQRVSLARTILQSQLLEAPVLILDDPFSQVDAGTEERIIDALESRKLFENKTTLFATHRMSMVQKADWVILMNHGEIVATGSHQDLLASQPLYQQLHRQDELRKQTDVILPSDDEAINHV